MERGRIDVFRKAGSCRHFQSFERKVVQDEAHAKRLVVLVPPLLHVGDCQEYEGVSGIKEVPVGSRRSPSTLLLTLWFCRVWAEYGRAPCIGSLFG